MHCCSLKEMLYLHDGNNLSSFKADSMKLCDPKSANALVQRGSVHIDGSAQRKNESADASVHVVVLLHTFYGGW